MWAHGAYHITDVDAVRGGGGILHEDEPIELIEGRLIVAEPQNTPHAKAIELAADALRAAFGPGWRIRVQLPIALEPDSEPEPDVSVVAESPRDDRDDHPSHPTLVVEVADTSIRLDRTVKARIYARGGIPEYWIVNLIARVVESYWRCPADHGRFITFAEFLREKNFVRPLSGQELVQLRANVTMIRCSSCGAPIDLEHTSVCGYCRTPVSVLDARQVETAVTHLKQAEAEHRTVDPALPVRHMANRLRVERLFESFDGSVGSSNAIGAPSLVEAGLATVAEFLTASD